MPCRGMRHSPGHGRSAAPSDSQASSVQCFLSPCQYLLWSYFNVCPALVNVTWDRLFISLVFVVTLTKKPYGLSKGH